MSSNNCVKNTTVKKIILTSGARDNHGSIQVSISFFVWDMKEQQQWQAVEKNKASLQITLKTLLGHNKINLLLLTLNKTKSSGIISSHYSQLDRNIPIGNLFDQWLVYTWRRIRYLSSLFESALFLINKTSNVCANFQLINLLFKVYM